MAETPIEWAWPPGYRGATWNPIDGCWPVSPGCAHCYAATMARRIVLMNGPAAERYRLRVVHKDGEPVAKWNGTFGEVPELLDLPLRTRTPTCWFVNSMSDLFGEGVSDEYIAAVFGVMAACPHHRFIVLTKRAERMARWFEWARRLTLDDLEFHATARIYGEEPTRDVGRGGAWPLPNVWIGVSVEDQQRADERIPHLLRVLAAVRFLSCEPLLGPVDLEHIRNGGEVFPRFNALRRWASGASLLTGKPGDVTGIDWVIVGGESGPGARPFDLTWARSIVEQCRAAGTAVFVKQLGTHPVARDEYDMGLETFRAWDAEHAGEPFPSNGVRLALRDRKGGNPAEWPADLRVREWPVKR